MKEYIVKVFEIPSTRSYVTGYEDFLNEYAKEKWVVKDVRYKDTVIIVTFERDK